MARSLKVFLLVFAVALGANLYAQQKGNGKQPAHNIRTFMPAVYLGNSDKKGGPIQKETFTNLMKQGLSSHDSLGNNYQVVGFDFTYSEQKLYEDSAGNMEVLRDLSAEYCPGDTLASDIAYARNMLKSVYLTDSADIPRGLYERIKPGDSLYFDHIRVVKLGKNSKISLADTAAIAGQGMKFYIAK